MKYPRVEDIRKKERKIEDRELEKIRVEIEQDDNRK